MGGELVGWVQQIGAPVSPDGILSASLQHHRPQLSRFLQAYSAPKGTGPGWHSDVAMCCGSCHEAAKSPVTGHSRWGQNYLKLLFQFPQLDDPSLVLSGLLLPDIAPRASRSHSDAQVMLGCTLCSGPFLLGQQEGVCAIVASQLSLLF